MANEVAGLLEGPVAPAALVDGAALLVLPHPH